MFRYRKELEIRCTPATLWCALVEPAGIESWFAPDARVTPGPGGSIWVSWGPGMEGESRITAWEPERRFAYTLDTGPGSEPNVTTFEINGEGEITRLVLTQSGLPNEDALKGVSRPWELFLFLLKHGCEHPHRAAQNVTVFRYFDTPASAIWGAIQESPAYQQIAADGRVVFEPGEGFRGIEFPEQNRSLTGMFCEPCGGRTAVTLMSILYDPPTGRVDGVRTAWIRVANDVAHAPAASAAV